MSALGSRAGPAQNIRGSNVHPCGFLTDSRTRSIPCLGAPSPLLKARQVPRRLGGSGQGMVTAAGRRGHGPAVGREDAQVRGVACESSFRANVRPLSSCRGAQAALKVLLPRR